MTRFLAGFAFGYIATPIVLIVYVAWAYSKGETR